MALASRLAECLSRVDGGPWTVEGVVAKRQNSRIYRARSAAARHVAIKECFAADGRTPDVDAAAREYEALRRLAAAAGAQAAPGPLPLVLCPDAASYVMTWVPGRTLTARLLSPATSPRAARDMGERAACWLAAFHALHPLPPRRPDFAAHAEHVRAETLALRSVEPLLAEAQAVLAGSAARAAADALPASWIHGDMKSDNLLVDGARVTGLDVHLAHDNAVIYDGAPFLNHLALLRWSPAGWLRARALRTAAEGFMAGYPDLARQASLPLRWLRSYLYLVPLLRLTRAPSGRTWALRAALRVELRRVVRQLG